MNQIPVPAFRPIRSLFPRVADLVRQRHLLSKRIDTLRLRGDDGADAVVVSLTSYPGRFPTLPIVLRSLLFQSRVPDAIVVWLDCSPGDLPDWADDFVRSGIQFRFVKSGLKSHNKWFYALREFSDSSVVTVDDDIAYPRRTLESLVAAHKTFPEAVCALRCHRINRTNEGEVLPYWTWGLSNRKGVALGPSDDLIATGCWGALYPPHVFEGNDFAFDEDLFLRHAPDADDIWLKFMEIISGRKVYKAKSSIRMFDIPGTQSVALAKENCFPDDTGIAGNDRAVAALSHLFSAHEQCRRVFRIKGPSEQRR